LPPLGTGELEAGRLFRKDCFNSALENRQLVLHRAPYDLRVYPEIFVDKDIPEACDFLPIHVCMLCTNLIRNLLACFSNDFQIADDGVERLLVLGQGLQRSSRGVTSDLAHGL
jgi:hypothetical protein